MDLDYLSLTKRKRKYANSPVALPCTPPSGCRGRQQAGYRGREECQTTATRREFRSPSHISYTHSRHRLPTWHLETGMKMVSGIKKTQKRTYGNQAKNYYTDVQFPRKCKPGPPTTTGAWLNALDFIVLLHSETRLPAPTQSHYHATKLTSPCLILWEGHSNHSTIASSLGIGSTGEEGRGTRADIGGNG